MRRRIVFGALFVAVAYSGSAIASDFVLQQAGRVEIELVGSEASWANSLSAHLVCPCDAGVGCVDGCICDRQSVDTEGRPAGTVCPDAIDRAAFNGTGLTIPLIGYEPGYPNNGCTPPSETFGAPSPVYLLSEKKAALLASPPDRTPTQRGCCVTLEFITPTGATTPSSLPDPSSASTCARRPMR